MSISSIIENLDDDDDKENSSVIDEHDDDDPSDEEDGDGESDEDDGSDDDKSDTNTNDSKDATDDEGDGEEEERAAHSDEAKEQKRLERVSKRARRRANQLAKERRRDNYIAELEGTLANVHDRLQQVEGRFTKDDEATALRMLRNVDALIEQNKREQTKALEEGDHKRVAELTDDLVQYRVDKQRMLDAKEAREAAAAEEAAAEKAEPKARPGRAAPAAEKVVDPAIVSNFGVFIKRNPLYKPDQPTNPVTMAVHAIDTELTKEGFDPRTKAYWEEAESRAEERGITLRPKKTSAPPKGEKRNSNSRSSSEGNGKGFTLDKKRVEALKEAGLWDDPKKRSEMRERYRKQAEQDARRS